MDAMQAPKKHIRPSVRKKSSGSNKAETKAVVTDYDPEVEETRQRMETWVGLGAEAPLETAAATVPPQQSSQKGILKQPKYSGASKTAVVDNVDNKEPMQLDPPQQVNQQQRPQMVQDVVMERPKRKPQRSTATKDRIDPTGMSAKDSAVAIEGYTPVTGAASAKTSFANGTKQGAVSSTDDDDPLIFNSLADMMETAGTLPDPNSKEAPAVVEAELSFSCMDPNEYEQEQQQIEEEDEPEPWDDAMVQEDDAEDDDDDASWDGFFGNDDEDEEEEYAEPREERAFLKLWTAVAQWITPQAVEYVGHLQEQQRAQSGQEFAWDTDCVPQFDRTDVGASRCAGLMALLQMHIPRCLEELRRPMEERRVAEKRLTDLLRSWDYSRPISIKLDIRLARALTCVLLDTVLGATDRPGPIELPLSCTVSLRAGLFACRACLGLVAYHSFSFSRCCFSQVVGMNQEEYRYLTRSAITSFGKPLVVE